MVDVLANPVIVGSQEVSENMGRMLLCRAISRYPVDKHTAVVEKWRNFAPLDLLAVMTTELTEHGRHGALQKDGQPDADMFGQLRHIFDRAWPQIKTGLAVGIPAEPDIDRVRAELSRSPHTMALLTKVAEAWEAGGVDFMASFEQVLIALNIV